MMASNLFRTSSALDHLLAEIVDTREKLDVLVYLHETGSGPRTTDTIATAVGHPSIQVAQALREFARAGIVATFDEDEAGWWLDPGSGWLEVIGLVVRLYDRDRIGLLRRMTRVALKRIRVELGDAIANVIVLRPPRRDD